MTDTSPTPPLTAEEIEKLKDQAEYFTRPWPVRQGHEEHLARGMLRLLSALAEKDRRIAELERMVRLPEGWQGAAEARIAELERERDEARRQQGKLILEAVQERQAAEALSAAAVEREREIRAGAKAIREQAAHHRRLAALDGISPVAKARDEGLAHAYEVSARTIDAALPSPAPADQYYVLSLKWSGGSNALTWWCPKNSGYTVYLDRAGKYSAAEIAAQPDYYNNGEGTLAVPCALADARSFRVVHDTQEVRVEFRTANPSTPSSPAAGSEEKEHG